MKTIWKVAIGLFVVGAIGATLTPKPTPEQKEAREKSEKLYTAVEYAKTVVPRSLRDPASAVFGKVNAYPDRKYKGKAVIVVCGTVNAKNGFGGYTGMKEFVLIPEMSVFAINGTDDNSKVIQLWNTLCVN